MGENIGSMYMGDEDLQNLDEPDVPIHYTINSYFMGIINDFYIQASVYNADENVFLLSLQSQDRIVMNEVNENYDYVYNFLSCMKGLRSKVKSIVTKVEYPTPCSE